MNRGKTLNPLWSTGKALWKRNTQAISNLTPFHHVFSFFLQLKKQINPCHSIPMEDIKSKILSKHKSPWLRHSHVRKSRSISTRSENRGEERSTLKRSREWRDSKWKEETSHLYVFRMERPSNRSNSFLLIYFTDYVSSMTYVRTRERRENLQTITYLDVSSFISFKLCKM